MSNYDELIAHAREKLERLEADKKLHEAAVHLRGYCENPERYGLVELRLYWGVPPSRLSVDIPPDLAKRISTVIYDYLREKANEQ